MKGYNSLKQYIQDYRIYLAAKRMDPGRDGETMTSFLKNKIDLKLKTASPSFKSMLKRNNYTPNDLKILATHEVIGEISDLREFGRVCFGGGCYSIYIKKIISANAFKNGKLKKVYEFIPLSIRSKKDFLEFMRVHRSISKSDLNIIMRQVSIGNWKVWLSELVKEDKLFFRRGSVCT